MTDPVHVTVWDDGAPPGPPVLLIHGSSSNGPECWAAQRPLAAHHRLLLMDRRGHGASPDLPAGGPTADFAIDAEDVLGLLTGGAHLVGHSYGGVVALLAAARRPDLIRSLTLIEPAALGLATHVPAVAATIDRNRAGMAQARLGSVEEFLVGNTAPFGLPTPEPTEAALRSARTALFERPCWEADIPLEPLARAPWPKLVFTGSWETADPEYRRMAGEALLAASAVVADRIGAERRAIPGAAHDAHHNPAINALLSAFWTTGAVPRQPTTQQ